MATQRMCWVVIPAAGMGTRMGGQIPKQYLPLAGKTVLEHTLDRFLQLDSVVGIVVVLSEYDVHWKTLTLATHKTIHTTLGGSQRCHSVLNGLSYLGRIANPDDLVLVHDAARPCIRSSDIQRLIEAAGTCKDGAILATQVRDTMKRAEPYGFIGGTVERGNLWHALTPQAFNLALLRSALGAAIEKGINVTDDAQAVELTGRHPLLVEGRADNIKITSPSDLKLAELYLKHQE